MTERERKDKLTAQLHALIKSGNTKGKLYDDLVQQLYSIPRQSRSPWESITVVSPELKENDSPGSVIASMEFDEYEEEEEDEEEDEEDDEEEEEEESELSPKASECSEASSVESE